MRRSVFLFLVLFCSCTSQKPGIAGVWYFDRFGGPLGEISQDPALVKANSENKGTIFTFGKDNKMIVDHPGGQKINQSIVNYQVFYDLKQVIIDKDTMKIMLLTKDILELYPKSETRPALFLKRTKDGKTAMSAP